MFPYANYKFYTEKTHGKLPMEDFERLILEASFYLRYITLGKSDWQEAEELQYAVCAIADMYFEENEKAKTGSLKSENNDGYSVTYIAEQKDGESVEEFLGRKAMLIARKYLISTGMLNRKVEVHHADQCGYHYL